MKYIIVCLIKGKAKQFNETLMSNVAKNFNVNGAVERKPPSHITLKYGFETDEIKDLEQVIENFCESNKKTKYKLNGFDSFDKNVIFIKVEPSNEMINIHKKFINELKKIKWMTWKKFDGNVHFHASVAHSDINENNFDEIWNYVNQNKPKFDLFFDNITLLKLIDGVWKVHKEFLMY
jgi:2'-5' RNA ligase